MLHSLLIVICSLFIISLHIEGLPDYLNHIIVTSFGYLSTCNLPLGSHLILICCKGCYICSQDVNSHKSIAMFFSTWVNNHNDNP